MRPTQAKEYPAAMPPVPRLVPVSGSPARARPDGPSADVDHGPAAVATDALRRDGPLPAVLGDAHTVDADVPAAVGRMLEHVLADRLARAGLVDPLFARDLADRVARFTQEGGKRVRAQLLWWSLRACGGSDPAAVTAALRTGAALELLQTCALVHDDVMDRSSLRRGRPSLHADVRVQYADHAPPDRVGRFGESAAILAGDLALAWADDLVAETPLPAWTAIVVRRLWSDMRTEMVAGQYLDVQGQTTGALSMPRALRAACLKSALYSVERPLALGAALAGADDATLKRLCSAGRCVGMAFQLRDDLDDLFGDPCRTGKTCGGDIREGKPTYLVALARARAEAAGDRAALGVLDRCLGNTGLTLADLDDVRDVLTGTGARATVETKIDRLVAQGLRHFDGAVLDPDTGPRLRTMLGAAAAASTACGPRPAPGTPASVPRTACAEESRG
ncbi:polyprenyl synthetase family protein [Streptomyces sp. MUM 2J]|uniref:polyprenyl synthetase family protein n=1 Tax=Streptomyces sp. MUM 2J TaxID=2791987 RepID=UPI001F03DBBC|nr:polyprenyl synthetase family protein [Streptomyces sp. MUM 2J]MCH0564197.1 polyprenyl synthetase family protein [Streptomyces sp. MUM 2J]